MNDTLKGQGKIGDNEFDFEAVNVRPGKAPDSIWMGLAADGEDRGAVALVGWAKPLLKFRQYLKERKIEVRMHVCMFERANFGVILIGDWPRDRLKGVIEQISGGGTNGPRQWAKEYRKIRLDPDRQRSPDPDEEMAKFLVNMFFDQCLRVTN